MRYVVGFGDDPDHASILVGPQGGTLLYDTLEEAADAAKTCLKGTLADVRPDWNAFVFKLVPAALYMPVPNPHRADLPEDHPDREPYIDETVLSREKENVGGN